MKEERENREEREGENEEDNEEEGFYLLSTMEHQIHT
jgi:hypothetical protein